MYFAGKRQRLTAASHPDIDNESDQMGQTSFDIHTKLDHTSESIQSHSAAVVPFENREVRYSRAE